MTKYCECGCGQSVKEGNRFVVGHNRRGTRQSIQERRKRARSIKQSLSDPRIREKMIMGLKKAHENPECWKNFGPTMSKIMKKRWADSKFRRRILKGLRSEKEKQRRSEMARKMWQDPSHRQRFSEKMKKHWQDLEYRLSTLKAMRRPRSKKAIRKMSEASKKWLSIPKHRQKVAEDSRKRWQNPDYRRRVLSVLHSPENRGKQLLASKKIGVRKQISESVKKLHRDPEYRRKFLEGRKEMWQRSEYVRKQMISRGVKPNKPEKTLIQLIAKNSIPYRYCGDGDVVIGGKCPDFINYNGAKKLVELFGIYWHGNFPDEEQRRTLEAKRAEHFAEYGFKTLVIWEDELGNLEGVVEKIKTFTEAVV